MSAIASSQKSFIAFYTSDSSLPSGPQIQVFEYKREAEAILDDGDSSGSSGTVCALVRTSNTSTTDGRPCAMMCLTTPIYKVTLAPTGSVSGQLKIAETFEFRGG
jgi:hypothetical protein